MKPEVMQALEKLTGLTVCSDNPRIYFTAERVGFIRLKVSTQDCLDALVEQGLAQAVTVEDKVVETKFAPASININFTREKVYRANMEEIIAQGIHYDFSIDDLGLSRRAERVLKKSSYLTLGDLAKATEEELKTRGIGRHITKFIRRGLGRYNINLGESHELR